MSSEAVTILLVEDDAGHASLIRKNLDKAGISNPVVVAEDGQQGLDFVFARCGSAEEPLLVLLDLDLPVVDGYAVLETLKSDPRTKHVPVIVLTSTDDPREIRRCYDLGCAVYITKPVSYEHFSQAIRNLGLLLSVVTVRGDD